MKNFIITNWISIIAIVMLICWVSVLIIKKKWIELRELAYSLMLTAERIYNENDGDKKFDTVLETYYIKLPVWIRLIIKKKTIKDKLQEWYDLAKDRLYHFEFNG